jgi:hypothetical protein
VIFLSKYGKYGLSVRAQIVEAYAQGMTRETTSPLYAQFEVPPALTAREREWALAHFAFNGLQQEMDEATHVPPDHRIGRFDSVAAQAQGGWSDEERIAVENELIRTAEIVPEELTLLPEIVVPAPWPSYHDFKGTGAALAKKVREDGYDPNEVLAYEVAHENRDEVVAALGQLIAADVEELTEADLEVVG